MSKVKLIIITNGVEIKPEHIELAKQNKYSFRIVTIKGDLINPSGAITGGSVAQKTSGNNMNYSPTYSATTDKIVFRCQNEGNNTSDRGNKKGTYQIWRFKVEE